MKFTIGIERSKIVDLQLHTLTYDNNNLVATMPLIML